MNVRRSPSVRFTRALNITPDLTVGVRDFTQLSFTTDPGIREGRLCKDAVPVGRYSSRDVPQLIGLFPEQARGDPPLTQVRHPLARIHRRTLSGGSVIGGAVFVG